LPDCRNGSPALGAEGGTDADARLEQQAISVLQSHPQMRAAFINKVAAPIANKLFDCGMIP
jgi:hypothetical protein